MPTYELVVAKGGSKLKEVPQAPPGQFKLRLGAGAIITYDQWEDGYEADLANPTQATTQVWGDGNPANGDASTVCSLCAGDLIPQGAVIILRNNITTPRDSSQIRYDGRDQVGSTRGFALTAGGFTHIGLQITSLPSAALGTVTLSRQSPSTQSAPGIPAAQSPQGVSIPNAPIPGAALLPDAVYQAFGSAYIRIQKAALLANQFALTAAEIAYLSSAGAATPPLFAGFDLNALPLTPGVAVPPGMTELTLILNSRSSFAA